MKIFDTFWSTEDISAGVWVGFLRREGISKERLQNRMIDESEFIRVVTKENEECFVLTTLKAGGKEGFELSVCQGTNVFTGTVSEDDLDALSRKQKMGFDQYLQKTVEALTSAVDNKDTFQYQLKRQKSSAEFIWKKHLPAEDITFQLGSTMLQNRVDSAEFISKMFNYCIKSMDTLKDRIRALETDNERISQERINALKRLEKCVVAKEELENDLYSKFTLVLNSKKDKIRQLKHQAEEQIAVAPREAETLDEKPAKRSAVTPTQVLEEQSYYDKDTDEEDTPKPKRQKQSKAALKSKADDSLDLGVDEEASGPIVTRPRRHQGAQKKQTPSKPVLPRVGSNESQPSRSSRRQSMKKSTSSGSNRSSDNPDPEDLFSQL